jgi:hypothetical protein
VGIRGAFSPACLRLALAARLAARQGSRGRDPEGRAKKDPALAAAGAVRFLEKASLALEHVDIGRGRTLPRRSQVFFIDESDIQRMRPARRTQDGRFDVVRRHPTDGRQERPLIVIGM